MNKAVAIFLILASLISFAAAADVMVMVGGAGLTFSPATVNANPGDNIVFMWQGTVPHSVLQSDAAKSCNKSVQANAFTSGGSFSAPHTFNITAGAAGKQWFYCGVPGHCEAGMYGTLLIGQSGSGNASTPSGSASGSAGGAMPTSTGSGSGSGSGAAAPSGTAPASSAARNYAAGFVVSSMFLAGSFML